MPPKNGAGAAHRTDADTRKNDQLGGKVNFLATRKHKPPQAIHAVLAGDDTCTAAGFTAYSPAPILKLCRLLADAGHNPDRPLQAWRGGTLCLTIRSIGEAAQLALNSKGTNFVRCRQAVRIAPLASLTLRNRRRGTA